MLIRDIDRSQLPRNRDRVKSGKSGDANPLRKTAEGLGTFLNRLSESVRESRDAQSDSVDSGIRAHSRAMRSFKWPAPEEDGAAPAPVMELNFTEDEQEAYDTLREAKNVAADASSAVMQFRERAEAQERLKSLFLDISAKRIDILASMISERTENDNSFLSLMTPESARATYTAIDKMIMRFLDTESRESLNGDYPAQSEHEAALNAAEQLREFLLSEGPAKAFSRFREINRSNVLGLIQQ